jgi:hypothetical protein
MPGGGVESPDRLLLKRMVPMRSPYQTKIVVAIAMPLSLGLVHTAGAAPRAELWPRWQAHDPQSSTSIDHLAWGRFLESYLVVDKPGAVNLVRYQAVTAPDRKALDQYVAALAAVSVTNLDRAEQKAYWINFYNALTVKIILDNYPVKSIRDIKSGLFSPGPWDLKLVRVEGVELSLNDIEHRILRPIWQDNRIHYAVNCASLGCPNLQPEPFTAENSERLLDKAAGEYVNSSRGARIEGRTLILSEIYDWYQADFAGSRDGVIRHLRQWSEPPLAAALQTFSGGVIYDYDWRLNELKK